jgi:two-component system cell cycle sensor histidine kinase PleC
MLCKQFIIDDVILSEASQNHKNLVLAYQNTIWNSYSEVVKKQHHNSILDTEINRLYVKYLKDTSNFFKHSNSIRIDILDDERNLIFSSNDVEMIHDDYQTLSLYDYITAKIDELLFAQSHHKDWISLAYNGKIVRSLLTNVKIEPKISKEDRISVSVDYIPLINNQGHTESVVVLYTNASNLIKGIWGLEHRIIAFLLILALIFCIMVAYNTYYTRRVITEQLRVNKLLEEAKARAESESSAKTEFLAGVSHELRTPLNAIIGFSEMILSEHGKDIEKSQHDSYISSIHHAGKHLLSVINDILDYLKAASDKLNVDMVDVDINKIVRSSMRLIAPKAIEKKY